MTLKELKDTKRFIDVFMVVAAIILIVSLFAALFNYEGVLYNTTDDTGEKLGFPYEETLMVYDFALPLKSERSVLYYSWEMSVFYLVLILSFGLNFINLKKYNRIKQFIIGGTFIIGAVALIIIVVSYHNEMKLIAEEFLLDYFDNSTLEVKSSYFPILAYLLGIFAGLLSVLKAWVIGRIQSAESRKLKKASK
jgi:hypothetical protein